MYKFEFSQYIYMGIDIFASPAFEIFNQLI
jgi:hypothetical protein